MVPCSLSVFNGGLMIPYSHAVLMISIVGCTVDFQRSRGRRKKLRE